MTKELERWVPKVHPITRHVEPEDPMELVATPVQGDPDFMLECIIQEFAWMGMDADQLMKFVQNSDYPVLNQLQEHFGADEICRRIRGILGRSGIFRFRETIVEEAEEEENEHQLIQISVGRVSRM